MTDIGSKCIGQLGKVGIVGKTGDRGDYPELVLISKAEYELLKEIKNSYFKMVDERSFL